MRWPGNAGIMRLSFSHTQHNTESYGRAAEMITEAHQAFRGHHLWFTIPCRSSRLPNLSLSDVYCRPEPHFVCNLFATLMGICESMFE